MNYFQKREKSPRKVVNPAGSGGLVIGVILAFCPAQAQLLATDDAYGVPYARALQVEAPGVMVNDRLDGQPAAEAGAIVERISGPANGTLTCPATAMEGLCADGAFDYLPDGTFTGTDQFYYRLQAGDVTVEARVVLDACRPVNAAVVCWKASAFLQQAAAIGLSVAGEGFESDAVWGSARYPLTQAMVSSQGISWRSNHAGNVLTTSQGSARRGNYGVLDPDHGQASGTVAECDVDNPPPACFYYDGLTGIRDSTSPTLMAVGGYFSAAGIAKLEVLLDSGAPLVLGAFGNDGFHFFGVIALQPFNQFRWQETNGKVGDPRIVFADDFLFGWQLDDGIFQNGFE